MSKESKFLTGIIIGAIAGVATGILLATESGEKTRKKIVVKTSELKEDLEAKLNDVSEKIKNIENEDLNSLKDKFFDVKEKNKDQYANIVDKAETIEKDIVSKYKGIKKEAKETICEEELYRSNCWIRIHVGIFAPSFLLDDSLSGCGKRQYLKG